MVGPWLEHKRIICLLENIHIFDSKEHMLLLNRNDICQRKTKLFTLGYYLSLAISCNANYNRMVNQMLFYVIFALIVLQRIKSYYQGLSIDWIRKQPHNRVTVIIYFTTETIIGLNNRVGTFHNACSNTTSFV